MPGVRCKELDPLAAKTSPVLLPEAGMQNEIHENDGNLNTLAGFNGYNPIYLNSIEYNMVVCLS